MTRIFFALSIILTIACSKPPSPVSDPRAVDASDVKSILMSSTTESQKACASDVTKSQGKLLYQNDSGLIFTDIAPGQLNLSPGCSADVSPNNPVTMPKAPPADKRGNIPDVSTILKLIPAEEIGARSFIAKNPAYDGRGVTVAILDTGIELDHPLLRRTTTGEAKVVDFEDFSGEGKLTLTPVRPEGFQVTAPNGKSYSLDGINGSDFKVAIFAGSTLSQADDLSQADKFEDVAVITYLSANGTRYGRVDTNNDLKFADEVELSNYASSRTFTKLGKKKLLSSAMNISADGSTATLCFDDGGHGTHVAGITAGYIENGLSGVAPGAQVIAVKIGDNRLAGGSTTTASMLLAIDYAVSKNSRVLNLSYGIHSGGNIGKSAIDQYVDKIAKEKDILFAISAGNEGPALLTIGTPAGANLAISNAAYISKETALVNYGYLGVKSDNSWYFSSVGPRQDGGWKPSLLAPGSAIASVPLWDKSYQNFRGTSMASPQVTGGLALLLAAAQADSLPSDRAAITRAVYRSAKVLPNLMRIEQGHGLVNINGAHDYLVAHKDAVSVEYGLSVTSPTSPTGKGAGIYLRDGVLPANNIGVAVIASLAEKAPLEEKDRVRTFKLEPSAKWISTPPTFWTNSIAKTFQVSIDPSVFQTPGLYSEVIAARGEASGEVEFEVPVTVIVPHVLSRENLHTFSVSPTLEVGQTLRYFIKVPQGATSLAMSLETDGPVAWAQLVDPEGHTQLDLRETEVTPPMPSSRKILSVKNGGVYELDLIAPPNIGQPVKATVKLSAYSLDAKVEGQLGEKKYSISILNSYDPIKVIPNVEIPFYVKGGTSVVKGDSLKVPFDISKEDLEKYSSIEFQVVTAKKIYDLMTDYPFRLFDPKGKVAAGGGLEMDSPVSVPLEEKTEVGTHQLLIQGAFTHKAPDSWAVNVREKRMLKDAKTVLEGTRTLIEQGQTIYVEADLTPQNVGGYDSCPVIVLESPAGTPVQQTELCD